MCLAKFYSPGIKGADFQHIENTWALWVHSITTTISSQNCAELPLGPVETVTPALSTALSQNNINEAFSGRPFGPRHDLIKLKTSRGQSDILRNKVLVSPTLISANIKQYKYKHGMNWYFKNKMNLTILHLIWLYCCCCCCCCRLVPVLKQSPANCPAQKATARHGPLKPYAEKSFDHGMEWWLKNDMGDWSATCFTNLPIPDFLKPCQFGMIALLCCDSPRMIVKYCQTV